MTRAHIFTGLASGQAPPPPSEAADLIIAADQGFHLATAAGVRISHLIGDMDSLSESDLAGARAAGTVVRRHPEDKDATDLELALALAHELGATSVVVFGGGGGRLDHVLVNAAVLTAPQYASLKMRAFFGRHRIDVLRGAGSLELPVGGLLTLLPWGGDANVVALRGTTWPLENDTLSPHTGRGLSNVVEDRVDYEITTGVVLAISETAV